jgi:hypothetical protein
MLPDFDDDGYLPPGVHLATLEEVRLVFGEASEIRQVQFESVEWLMSAATVAGARRVILNGSWTTAVAEPNDVDCIVVVDNDFPAHSEQALHLLGGFPFLSIEIAREADLPVMLNVFLSDRSGTRKGVVEVRL